MVRAWRASLSIGPGVWPKGWKRLTRRAFLGRSSAGLGAVALASLLDPDLLRGAGVGQASSLPVPQGRLEACPTKLVPDES